MSDHEPHMNDETPPLTPPTPDESPSVLPDDDTKILAHPDDEENRPAPVPSQSDDPTLIEARTPLDSAAEAANDRDLAGSAAEVEAADDADAETEESAGGDWVDYTPLESGSSDLDAALAAVASLGSLDALDREESRDELPTAEPPLESEPFDAVEPETATAAARSVVTATAPSMSVPPLTRLKRGSPGSLIPALALIGVGAWLTFTTTTGGTVDPLVLMGIGMGTVILSLLAYWISTGRWSRGVLFAAALVLLVVGVIGVTLPLPSLNLSPVFSLAQVYPLLLAAVGVAMLIGGALARPRSGSAFAPGIVLLAAGLIGFLITLGIIPQSVLNFAAPLWFVPVVLLVIVWLLPLVFRLREKE